MENKKGGWMSSKNSLYRRWKAQHHLPYNSCATDPCCVHCRKCDTTLLDDGRVDKVSKVCEGWRKRVECSKCGQDTYRFYKRKPRPTNDR